MIITDEKILRTKCSDALEHEVGSIIDQLELELKNSADIGRPGIGLSAIQIGIPKNVAIVRISNSNGTSFNVNLVNCHIAKGFDLSYFDNEGCLSFPNKYVRTKRYQEIYVVDNLVEPFNFVGTGIFAVCIQHELNHLEGILLPDLSEI